MRVGPALAWALAGVSIGAVLWRIGDGFDLTDESANLLAADPPARGDAFNGLAGLYLRPLWVAVHWDVAAVRIIGLAVLLGVAVLLGRSVARLLVWPPGAVVATTVAGASGFYASGLRTPSYNWLAMVGAMLCCAAAMRLLAEQRPAWAGLGGAGVFVAGTGKVTTAAVLAVALLLVCAPRPKALAWAGSALAVLVSMHLAFVLSATATWQTLRRVAAMMATVDPIQYNVIGSVTTFVVGLEVAMLRAGGKGGLLGLATVIGTLSREHRARWFARICALSLPVVAAMALITGAWGGGYSRWVIAGGGATALLIAVAAATLVGRLLSLPRDPPGAALGGCALLVMAAGGCLLGSTVRVGTHLNAVTTSGYSGLNATAKSLRDASMVYNCMDLAGAARTDCQASLAQPYQQKGLLQDAMKSAAGRLTQINSLMDQINGTSDQKAVLEIQARIGAENALLAHEVSQVQMLQGMADSEERIARSRERERQYQMLGRTGKVSDFLP